MTVGRIPSVEGGIQPTIFDAKADILTATAADTPARLAVGSNNQVLTVDSSTATGLKWATPATPTSGLTLISRTAFSNVASQAFDSVFSSTYKTYMVVIENFYAATSTDDPFLQMRYSGTTQTAGYYQASFKFAAGTFTHINAAAGGELQFADSSGTSGEPSSYVFYMYGVGNTSETARGHYEGYNSNNTYYSTGGFMSSVGRTYTGFLLKSSSSNITGTVSIYGLAIA
jgi:hypothetical protein